ncbi:helix-turn-helix domain-containing protein [Dehalococcoidia bacterium]|nr:helix-turn-helix domain-containing protein [Dehalococcoidia bacterium]MCL0043383.1 helix-turn-helix domain-containing protein [Dehalococcoidia bacterium]
MMKSMQMDHWVTPHQAAEIMKVSLNDVMQLIANRDLKATHLGSSTIPYIHKDELARYQARKKK